MLLDVGRWYDGSFGMHAGVTDVGLAFVLACWLFFLVVNGSDVDGVTALSETATR